jgi:Pretoxin HINT domain
VFRISEGPPHTRLIEQVELGDRVGPELDICSATDFAQWREVDLVMTVDNHGTPDELELHLLRPEAWIREQGMVEGHLVSVTLDDLNVSGPARVVRLGSSGQVLAGKRCPVTGWMRHTSHDVIPLTLEGDETLQVTRHHRLFSADRGDWVHAGDIQDGEALLTEDGVVHAKHAGTDPLAPVEVFNLEVFGAHQYFVGAHRVLAHNVYEFANQKADSLAAEVAAAKTAGATVVEAGSSGFDAVINQGTVKFVVTQEGKLLVSPHTVNGVEISHAVLSGGRPVLAAGEAEIAGTSGSYVGLSISPNSGHFMPTEASLSIAKDAFAAVGVTF